VYTVLIGFVVPHKIVAGIFNLQGLAFMGLYLLSIVATLFSAWVFKLILKSKERSFLMIELPQLKQPLIKNVLLTVKEKVGTFIMEAGKVILIISIILWFLASYGPPGAMQNAISEVNAEVQTRQLDDQAAQDMMASAKLENSYAGYLGKLIEPAIRPLGFDWKIGIALITSFAAREVFVGTMATIYSVGSTDDEMTLRQRMSQEINPITGNPRYDVPTALSLLLFYVFAMQCMSTLAVTKRETKSWKWPIVQFTFMSVMAYVSSLLAYQLLS
jgi:ferrous iron transport protein B